MSKRRKIEAQQHSNYVERPLFNDPDDVLLTDLIAPPELHLMMGAAIKIHDALPEEMGEQNLVVAKWAQYAIINKKKLIRVGRFGRECLLQGTGNGCGSWTSAA